MSDLESTLYYVENHGPKPFTVRYAKRDYTVPPGKKLPMPVEPLKMAVGNWDAKNTEYTPFRTNEVRRLSMQYATYGAPWYTDDPDAHTAGIIEAGEKVHPYSPSQRIDGRRAFMHPNLPRLEVTDLDGNRVFTVLDDPDLSLTAGKEQARIEQATTENVQNDLAILERKMAMLLETLTDINPDAANDVRRRMNAPKLDPDAAVSASLDVGLDPKATGAMSIMNEELGLSGGGDDDTDIPSATTPVRKKAAAKKAAAQPVASGGE